MGQTLAIVALSLSGVAVALAILAIALATTSRRVGEDRNLPMADRYGFTVEFVQEALDRYETEGREVTLQYYSSPESVVGEWYVFVIDENGILIGHPDPGVLGRDLAGDLGVDEYGYRFGDVMLGATEQGPVGRLHLQHLEDRQSGIQTCLGSQTGRFALRLRLVPGVTHLAPGPRAKQTQRTMP